MYSVCMDVSIHTYIHAIHRYMYVCYDYLHEATLILGLEMEAVDLLQVG